MFCNISLQATAVWLSKEVPPPRQYKSSELVSELSLKLHDFILHQTGDPRYQADPLLGLKESLQRGEVVEYFSQEMGLVKLLINGRTVLFHLNQVWRYFDFLSGNNVARSGAPTPRQRRGNCIRRRAWRPWSSSCPLEAPSY